MGKVASDIRMFAFSEGKKYVSWGFRLRIVFPPLMFYILEIKECAFLIVIPTTFWQNNQVNGVTQ